MLWLYELFGLMVKMKRAQLKHKAKQEQQAQEVKDK